MIRNRGVITASTFLTMFFVGVGTAVIGAASKNIGLTASQIGLMITLQNVGFLVSVLICGVLADSVRKTFILSLASVVLGIAFSLFYQWPGFGVNLAIMIVIGMGMGAYEGVADTLLLEIHTRRENLYISINHFFVTFGELMITVYLIFLQMRWRRSILQAGIAAGVLAVLFALSKTQPKAMEMKKLSDRFRYMKEQRGTGTLFFLTLSAVGMELGIIGVLTAFLVDYRGFDLVGSKLGLIAFTAGIAGGRAVIGFIAKKGRLLGYLTAFFAVTSVLSALLFFVPLTRVPLFILMFLFGATISSIFPIIISITGLRYKQIAGTVLGIVKLGIPIGGIIIPFFLSLISTWVSFQFSLILFPLFGFFGLLVILFQWEQLR